MCEKEKILEIKLEMKTRLQGLKRVIKWRQKKHTLHSKV